MGPGRFSSTVRGWLVVVLVAFVLAEIAFRAILYFTTPSGMVFDPDLVFTFAPNSRVYDLDLNGMGALGDEVAPRRAGTSDDRPRIFLFGGSTSFSQTYVDGVRRNLRDRLGEPVSVTSFGRPRYTSYQAKELAARLFPEFQPDVAVLYLGINDSIYNTFAWLDGAPDVGFLNWRSPWPPVLFEGFRYHLVNKHLRSTPSFPPDRLRSETILRRQVEAVASEAERFDVRLVVSQFALALPSEDPDLRRIVLEQEPVMRHFWGDVDSTRRAVAAHNAVLAGLARQHGWPVAPVSEVIPRTSAYFNDLCHLTAAGNEVLAETIAQAVLQAMGPETR